MSASSWRLALGAVHRPDAARTRFVRTVVVPALCFAAMATLVQRFDAPLVLAASVALAGAAVLLLRTELATLLTVFLLYINFPAILTKQHGVPHLVAGAFILLLGLPLVDLLIFRRQGMRADTTFRLMLLLLGVMVVCSFGAVDVGVALETVEGYVLEGLVLYWLIFNVVRTLPTLRRVLWTVLLAGGLLSALSLYQTVTGSYTQEFGGLAYRNYVAPDLDARERVGGAKRETWDRAQGPLNEPNRFAQVLIVLLPLAVYLYRNTRSLPSRAFAIGLGGLNLAGTLLTLSRGAVLALLVMAGAMIALKWIRASRALVCVVLLAVASPAVPYLDQRVESIRRAIGLVRGDANDAREADGATLTRVTLMLAAVRVFEDHAILGVGPGQFPPFYSRKYGGDPRVSLRDLPPGNWRAHSLYLEIAAETGVVGLTAFLAIVVVLARGLWRARRHWLPRDRERSDIATAFCLSLLAYQMTGIFLHLSYQPYYWFLLALSGVALSIVRTSQAADASPVTVPVAYPATLPPVRARTSA